MKTWLIHAGVAAAIAVSVWAGSPAALASAGTVTQLSGTLSAKKADGSVRILSQKSDVQNGETLSTEHDSYAQVRFEDGTQVTMKPNTSLRIANVMFIVDRPKEDSFIVELLRGGMRAVTGLVGKRNEEKVEVNTSTSTIGIRGTTFSVDDCVSTACANLERGVYVGVADGRIVVRNAEGTGFYNAGQFGLIKPGNPPIMLPMDPGLRLTPPTTFRANLAGKSGVQGGKNLECVVRP